MSQENVELVRNLQLAPDVDIAELFPSDEMSSALADAVASLFHPDFDSVPPGVPGTERVHVGFDGLRAAWLGWMEPWLTYRTEIKQAFDAGIRSCCSPTTTDAVRGLCRGLGSMARLSGRSEMGTSLAPSSLPTAPTPSQRRG